MIFDLNKLPCKLKMLAQFDYPQSRYQKSCKEAHLDAKIYRISFATLWNPATVITILHTQNHECFAVKIRKNGFKVSTKMSLTNICLTKWKAQTINSGPMVKATNVKNIYIPSKSTYFFLQVGVFSCFKWCYFNIFSRLMYLYAFYDYRYIVHTAWILIHFLSNQ